MLALALLAGAATASAQEQAAPSKPVVFDVGDTQDIDSMNPLVGVTVPAYEAWNIQYAHAHRQGGRRTSRPIPGLAESWKGSDDGKTWTYKLRPNLKWSDGQPLTAEDVAFTINRVAQGGVAQLHRRRREPDAPRRRDPNTVVIHISVPDPEAADDGRLHPAQAHLGEARRQGDHEVQRRTTASARARSRSTKFEKGQFARFKANPNYWRRQAGGRRASSCATSTTPTRWSRRSSAARSTPPRTCPGTRSSSSRRTRTS